MTIMKMPMNINPSGKFAAVQDIEGIVKGCKTIAELTEYYNHNKNILSNNAVLMALLATRRKELQS